MGRDSSVFRQIIGPIAQWIERNATNVEVEGSNPSRIAKFIAHVAELAYAVDLKSASFVGSTPTLGTIFPDSTSVRRTLIKFGDLPD